MERTFVEAEWVRRPPVSPNVLGFGLGLLLAGPAIALVVSLLGAHASQSAVKLAGMSVGFTCLASAVALVRNAVRARTIQIACTANALRIGAELVPAGDLVRITYELVRSQVPTRLGGDAAHTEDTRLEIERRGGRVVSLLAMDQNVLDVGNALHGLEHVNPELVLVPREFSGHDAGKTARRVYGTVATGVAALVGWLILSDVLDARHRRLATAASVLATARDGELVTLLQRVRVDVPTTAPCSSLPADLPLVDERWRAYLASGQTTKRPDDPGANSRVFRYLSHWLTPSGVEGWQQRGAAIEQALAAPQLGVVGEYDTIVVYRARDGAPECALPRAESLRLVLAARAADAVVTLQPRGR